MPATPTRLIDPVNGTVLLRLVPFYLERLHGPSGLVDDRTAIDLGLPFPFLRGAPPIDVTLRPGMTPETLRRLGGGYERNSSLGTLSWGRWTSYALTPFGWVHFPTPFFQGDRLSALDLQLHGATPTENFEAMSEWLLRELGAPQESVESQRQTWERAWGSAILFFEPRDGYAQLRIEWSSQ
ncbi:MAG TPA: hypothetical protein VJ865_07830 [Gemmatimonadaceae bacterium]|nr:hypothetical protein [Gemmatimonadaceae bacterium]